MVLDHDGDQIEEVPAGGWDLPEPDSILVTGAVEIAGWARPSSDATPARVTIRRHGKVVGEAVATQLRPDVAGVHGDDYALTGWSLEVTAPEADYSYELEVVATVDGIETVLGNRTFRVDPAPEVFPQGHVDSPYQGQKIAGQVIAVEGWTVPGGELADSIEVFVDDEPPVRIRRCSARLDVEAAGVFEPGLGIVAGYTDYLPVRGLDRPRDVNLVVRASGRNGDTWYSPPVRVSLVDELPEAYAQPLPQTPMMSKSPRSDRGTGKPRVCVVTHSLKLGGGQLYLQELLLRLAAKDVAEMIVISPADGPLRDELEAAGIGVHVTAPYVLDPSAYIGRLAELGGLMTAWDTDLVLANTLGVFPAVDAAITAGLPTVWAVHESFDLDVYGYLNWAPHGLHPEVHQRMVDTLAATDLVVFESDATHRMYADAVPKLTGRRIMYGIDLAEIARYEGEHDREAIRTKLGFGPDTRVLLCMGVMEERKAQLALVEAFAAVADAHPDVRLVLVGDHDGAYADAVRTLVEIKGLSESVLVIPIVADTYEWYLCADVLVSASDTESLPRSVLEAMTFGLPVLAVDVFGLSEVVVDGENGWLCAPRDGRALFAALRRVMDCDATELAAMSARCRQDALGFDGDGYAEAFAEMIRALPDGLA